MDDGALGRKDQEEAAAAAGCALEEDPPPAEDPDVDEPLPTAPSAAEPVEEELAEDAPSDAAEDPSEEELLPVEPEEDCEDAAAFAESVE